MFKRYRRYIPFALIVVPVVIVAVLLLSTATTQASSPSAPTAVYNCTPTGVAVFTNRVHVRCSQPVPTTTISYFAYCSTTDSATASRFLSVFTTAKATLKAIDIYYTPTDLSGASCGCSNADCRVLTGAEVKP